MALAIVVGRIGCFLPGDDGVGQPTSLPWAYGWRTAREPANTYTRPRL
jgi:hypothetical protein